MRRMAPGLLAILAVMTGFWAYAAIDTLLRDFSTEIQFLDLAVIFVLGLIAGLAVGLIPATRTPTGG